MQLNSGISAVITGGASGLGAATARRLASHGVKVAIFDMNEAVGQALASELGGVYCNVDVTSEEQVDAAFAKARAAIGQERVLVNCAGTADAVLMVESEAKELPEDVMLGAVMFGHKNFQPVIEAIIRLAEKAAKEPRDMSAPDLSEIEKVVLEIAEADLRAAGCREVWDDPEDLLARYHESLLGKD